MSVYHINKQNFESAVKNSEKPVLLDFYATWCGPCRMVSPIIDEIAAENPDYLGSDYLYENADKFDYLVGKINVDEEPELAQAFGVISIPTLVVMKNGQVEKKSTGARPKAQILSMLRS